MTVGVLSRLASAGALVLLERHDAANHPTLDFTICFSPQYVSYLIEFVKLVPATNAAGLRMRVGTGGGPTYDSTAGHYGWSAFISLASVTGVNGSTSDTFIGLINSGLSSVSSRGGASGFLYLYDPQNASDEKIVTGQLTNRQTTNGDATATWSSSGSYYQTTALTAIQFFMTSGNIASGTIRVYGVSKV